MKTLFSKQIPGNERKWFIVSAEGKTLGRLATELARILSGRNAVDYSPHNDNGAYVVVTHVESIAVTGKKESEKMYRRHSQYMGGLKETNLSKLREKNPTRILEHAVLGMLPKNKHQSDMIARLRLVTGADHQYVAQKPESISL